jgi:hypothetical protein
MPIAVDDDPPENAAQSVNTEKPASGIMFPPRFSFGWLFRVPLFFAVNTFLILPLNDFMFRTENHLVFRLFALFCFVFAFPLATWHKACSQSKWVVANLLSKSTTRLLMLVSFLVFFVPSFYQSRNFVEAAVYSSVLAILFYHALWCAANAALFFSQGGARSISSPATPDCDQQIRETLHQTVESDATGLAARDATARQKAATENERIAIEVLKIEKANEEKAAQQRVAQQNSNTIVKGITVYCKSCGKKNRAPKLAIGKKGKCAQCNAVMVIPTCDDPEPIMQMLADDEDKLPNAPAHIKAEPVVDVRDSDVIRGQSRWSSWFNWKRFAVIIVAAFVSPLVAPFFPRPTAVMGSLCALGLIAVLLFWPDKTKEKNNDTVMPAVNAYKIFALIACVLFFGYLQVMPGNRVAEKSPQTAAPNNETSLRNQEYVEAMRELGQRETKERIEKSSERTKSNTDVVEKLNGPPPVQPVQQKAEPNRRTVSLAALFKNATSPGPIELSLNRQLDQGKSEPSAADRLMLLPEIEKRLASARALSDADLRAFDAEFDATEIRHFRSAVQGGLEFMQEYLKTGNQYRAVLANARFNDWDDFTNRFRTGNSKLKDEEIQKRKSQRAYQLTAVGCNAQKAAFIHLHRGKDGVDLANVPEGALAQFIALAKDADLCLREVDQRAFDQERPGMYAGLVQPFRASLKNLIDGAEKRDLVLWNQGVEGYQTLVKAMETNGWIEKGTESKESANEAKKSPPKPVSEIHAAVMKRDIGKITSLLKVNPELVNLNDNERKETPLMVAADKGFKDAAELLLKSGASIDARNKSGWTPLHIAADGEKMEHIAVAELLIKHGANVNSKDHGTDGETPLHSACDEADDRIEMVRLLLRSGAEVNAKDSKHRWTPIHYSASGGFPKITETLVAMGADVNAQNDEGRTPLDLALEPTKDAMRKTAREITAEILRKAGGKSGTPTRK